jgi:hypothetical protein
MTEKLLVIISTAEIGVARTGMMYALNALKHCWMEEVKIFFFGPAQQLLLEDEELQHYVQEYLSYQETAVACKFIADRDHITKPTDELGVKVAYVGQMISDLIKDGFVPMVW